MCKTYNKIGSLTSLKSHLVMNNIHDFKSLKDVMDFQNSYSIYIPQIIFHHKDLIEQEKSMLNLDLQQLDTTIETQKLYYENELKEEIDKLKQQLKILTDLSSKNWFQKLIRYPKKYYYIKKIKKIKENEHNLDFNVKESISELANFHQDKYNRYQFIISQFDDAVKQSSQYDILELQRKKTTIDELTPFIYGALGEQKVVKVLENLSDEYFLINDFTISFSYPIYNAQENDYIKSVQIDHILVAPSGIFLIETKNWSEKSLENLSLRSPVQQIKRASFILFKLLNNEISNYHLYLDKHHWGDKKISIRNLIVFTNTKPKEEFQYVKILTLNELLGYIKYFKPIFSNIETQRIAEHLLNINNQKH